MTSEFFAEFNARLRSRPRVFLVLFLIFILGVSGPFGTYEAMGTGMRMVYWGAIVFISMLALFLFDALLVVLGGIPFWQHAVLVAAWMGAIEPPVVRFVHGLFFHPAHMAEDLPDYWLIFWLASFLTAFFYVFWCMLINGRPLEAPAISRRLRAPHARILRMRMRDHYVDVFTESGVESILMRFSDALEEVNGLEGMRVHRSHWVARDEIRQGVIRQGRLFLKLSDGAEVPVSRGYRAEVEAQMTAGGRMSRLARLMQQMERCRMARRLARRMAGRGVPGRVPSAGQ